MANFLGIIFWPALLLGLALAVAWRFVPPGRLRTNLQIVASLLVFLPQLFIIFLLYQSIALLLYQEALLSLWMLGIATMIAWRLWQRWSSESFREQAGQTGDSSRLNRLSRWRATEDEVAFQSVVQRRFQERQQKRNPLVLIVIVLLFGGFGIYLGRTFVLDAFAPRIVVQGTVRSLKYNRGSRAPRLSTIVIDGRAFNGTRDLHAQLRPGDQIRAEVGAGSHAILRFSNDSPRQARTEN